ncbi:unnamed protein product [Dovyalis caffra]|uniref:PGG domain-containing protein n=1 Tax=Dovyalis caffra TaxID=77055 RepID=A0AAV1SHV9_9ROSI|nr:unnamed protein product [Dovyalis caffra]
MAESLVSVEHTLGYSKKKADALRKITEKEPELLHFRDNELENPLHFASSLGNLEKVLFLLKETSAVESSREGNLSIHVACKKGHVKVVEELLKQWSDPMEFVNQKRQEILRVAAVNGQENLVKYILACKCDSSIFDADDSVEAFKRCLERDSAEKLVTPSGNSLLHVALSYGSDKIADYLAKEFPSLITRRNNQGDTILHVAAREGRVSSTTKSIVGFNPSLMKKTNKKGNTPLHDSVIKGHKDVVVWLVTKEPDVAYYNNKTGKSPLYLAVENSNKKGVLDHLLNTEAPVPSIPIKGEDDESLGSLPEGESPVHGAIEHRNIDILKKIESAKPELFCLKDKELRNSLHYASSIGYLEGVQFLLQKFPASANEGDQEGNYPIHLACENDSVDVLKEFLKIFPYPKEFLNEKGQNILHAAAANGTGNVVRYILKQDQNLIEPLLNEMDADGNTPLHLATRHGQSTAAFVLVRDNRVERSIVNNDDLTPYEIAEQQSKIAVEQYGKTDEMLSEEIKHSASNNNSPVDGTPDGQVDSKVVKDEMKNSTLEKSAGSTSSQTKDKEVDPKKQDRKKASPKDYEVLNYYGAAFHGQCFWMISKGDEENDYIIDPILPCPPKKTLREHFSSTLAKPPRKEETKSRIENLLVVAVLVAGVTFSGAIQLPQLKSINSSNEHHHDFNSTFPHNTTAFDSPTGSSLLDGYLCLDVWALNTSVVAAIILLWTNLNDVKFAPIVVWFSSLMVGGSIYMMCLAFFFAVSIALGGSNYGVLATIIIVVGAVFFVAQTLLYIQWILPPSVNQILEGMLSHYVYYLSFFLLFYSWRWLPDKLSEIKRKRSSSSS